MGECTEMQALGVTEVPQDCPSSKSGLFAKSRAAKVYQDPDIREEGNGTSVFSQDQTPICRI